MSKDPGGSKFLACVYSRAWFMAALAVFSCANSETVAPPRPLHDLQSLAEFRELFNRDRGKPRLVLLLSPT
jgi:hypothetical protein